MGEPVGTRGELPEGEQRYRSLFEQTPIGIALTTSEGLIVEVNHTLAEMFGYTVEEMLRRRAPELYQDPETRSALLQKLSLEGRVTSFPAAVRHRDGRVLSALLSVSPVMVGERQMLQTTIIDVTELRQAEEALATARALVEREARFRTFIEKAPIAMATYRAGLTQYANPMYLEMFGFGPDERLTGRPLVEQIAPQCREEIAERARRRAQGLVVPTTYETVGLRKDGSQFPFLVSVSTVELSDRPAFLSYFTDITGQKEVQERLRLLNEELEDRVAARTRELTEANLRLRAEIEERARAEEERKRLIAELQRALAEVRTLGGLLPICAWCKRVRDDRGYWSQLEAYLSQHAPVEFSHGMCPDCERKLREQMGEKIDK